MQFEELALGDLFAVTSGGTPSRSNPAFFENGTIPWVKTGDLKGKYIYEAEEKVSELAIEKSAAKVFPENTVLLAMYGATIGACSILRTAAASNQACAAFLPTPKVLPEFLYYYLLSQRDTFINDGVGGAQPNISGTYLKRFKIPLPPLETQKHIARVLEQADALRKHAQQMETELNQLAQSLFLEMFGDPVTNPKKWPLKLIPDLLFFQEGPGVRNWQFRSSGIKLLNVRNIVDGKLVLTNTETYLDEQEVSEKYPHFLADAGDLVMASSGATWGKTAWVGQQHLPLSMNTSTIRFRPLDKEKVNSFYMWGFLNSVAFTQQIDRLITGSAQPNFGPSHLKQVKMALPTVETQQKYEASMVGIEKMKAEAKKRLEDIDALFKALMQRAFKGELTAKAA